MQPKDYKLETLPSFPKTLIHFRKYDGWKFLTATALILTFTYLLMGLIGYALDHNQWVQDLIFGQRPEQIPDKHWWNAVQFWTKPLGVATKEVLSAADILFRGLIFLCSYCFAWAAFDLKNIEGYIMGLFNMVVGMAYILSPTDFVPDVLPIVGSIDDTLFSGGMFGLGAYMYYRNALREQKTKTIVDMVNHNNEMNYQNLERALQLMLKDRGVHLEFSVPSMLDTPKKASQLEIQAKSN